MKMDYSNVSVDKALSMALRAEIDSQRVYEKLKSRVKNFVLRDKLDFLIREEEKHQEIVKTIFSRMFPEQDPMDVDRSLIPALTLSLEEEESVTDLLEAAMEAEKLFEEFYEYLADEVDERGTQEICMYLSNMEHGHYSLLKGEYDMCIRNETYYNREDFQYDMVHIGP